MLDFLAQRWFLILVMLGLVLATQRTDEVRNIVDHIPAEGVTAVVLLLMSVGLATQRLWLAVRRPGPVLLALAVCYGVAPLVGWYAANFVPEPYRIGLLVAACVPTTLASAAIWTRLAGGNDAVALVVTMTSNLLVFLATAAWLQVLTSTRVEFEVREMVTLLLTAVVAPVVLGQLLRAIPKVGPFVDKAKPTISIVSRLLILLIIIKSAVRASGAAGNLDAIELVQVGVVCIGVHLLLVLLGFRIGLLLFDRADAIAVGIAGGQKTLPVGFVLIDTYYAATYPLAIVPMLLFHVGQLVVDTYIAEKLLRAPTTEPLDGDEAEEGDPLTT